MNITENLNKDIATLKKYGYNIIEVKEINK